MGIAITAYNIFQTYLRPFTAFDAILRTAGGPPLRRCSSFWSIFACRSFHQATVADAFLNACNSQPITEPGNEYLTVGEFAALVVNPHQD